jgi:hypothetical protein
MGDQKTSIVQAVAGRMLPATLPRDIWQRLLSHVDVADLASLRGVNTQWRLLLPPVRVENIELDDIVLHLPREQFDKWFELLGKFATTLTSKTTRGGSVPMIMARALAKMPSLTSVDVRMAHHAPTILQSMMKHERLKELRLEATTSVARDDDEDRKLTIAAMSQSPRPALKLLHLQTVATWDNEASALAFTACLPPGLQDLELDGYFLTAATWKKLLTTCPRMVRCVLNNVVGGEMKTEDWKPLYQPARKKEWEVLRIRTASGMRPHALALDQRATLLEFARSGVRDTLQLGSGWDEDQWLWPPYTWERFIDEWRGQRPCPLRTLDWGRTEDAPLPTLFKCFPRLETCQGLPTSMPVSADFLIDAYARSWPWLMYNQTFPCTQSNLELPNEVEAARVLDHLIQHSSHTTFKHFDLFGWHEYSSKQLNEFLRVHPGWVDIRVEDNSMRIDEQTRAHFTELKELRMLKLDCGGNEFTGSQLTAFLGSGRMDVLVLSSRLEGPPDEVDVDEKTLRRLWQVNATRRRVSLDNVCLRGMSQSIVCEWDPTGLARFSCLVRRTPGETYPSESQWSKGKHVRTLRFVEWSDDVLRLSYDSWR